jgi:L-histidine N-alpha-methyltransferase
MTEHCESSEATAPLSGAAFAHDVRAGLTAKGQKSLLPKYLYDALGSALFEAITQLPEYGLWRAERRLLKEHAAEISAAAAASSVVELGSGSAKKTAYLLQALLRRQAVKYWSIELSRAAIDMTRLELAGLSRLEFSGIEQEYLPGLDIAMATRQTGGHALVLFLGSSLGNFDDLEGVRFLQQVRRILRPGDTLLLGADLVKPRDQLLAAYDDSLGVTGAFNLNLLVRMNRELGADFRLEQFRHRARFNADLRDVEMHIESRCDQEVRFSIAGFSAKFQAGETIHTESSHKYSLEELGQIIQSSGFRCTSQWIDGEWLFASSLCTAV